MNSTPGDDDELKKVLRISSAFTLISLSDTHQKRRLRAAFSKMTEEIQRRRAVAEKEEHLAEKQSVL